MSAKKSGSSGNAKSNAAKTTKATAQANKSGSAKAGSAKSGAAKNSANKASSTKKQEILTNDIRFEVFGILLIISAIALFIAVVAPGEALIAGAISLLCRMLFGVGALIMPFLLAAWGTSFFLHEQLASSRLRLLIGVSVIFVGALTLIAVNTTGASTDPERVFITENLISHGGYVGGAFAWLMLKLLGYAISMVVSVGAIIIGAVLIGFSMVSLAERLNKLFVRGQESYETAGASAYDLGEEQPRGRAGKRGAAKADDQQGFALMTPTARIAAEESARLAAEEAEQLHAQGKAQSRVQPISLANARAQINTQAGARSKYQDQSQVLTTVLPQSPAASQGPSSWENYIDDEFGTFDSDDNQFQDETNYGGRGLIADPDLGMTRRIQGREQLFDEGQILRATKAASITEAADEAAVKAEAERPEPTPIDQDSVSHLENIATGQQYELPNMGLLKVSRPKTASKSGEAELRSVAAELQATLQQFQVDAQVVGWTAGPTVTLFKLALGEGVRVARITSLADDIALALAASSVRVFSPIPGTSLVGVEVPNSERSIVLLGDVLPAAPEGALQVAVGKDVEGTNIVANVSSMPHLLIGGTTGSGKSVAINSMIMSMLMRTTPAEVQMILIDPKMVELTRYNDIPHLYVPVVTDAAKAASALNWAVHEMEERLKIFMEAGVKNIAAYNEYAKKAREVAIRQAEKALIKAREKTAAAAAEAEAALAELGQAGTAVASEDGADPFDMASELPIEDWSDEDWSDEDWDLEDDAGYLGRSEQAASESEAEQKEPELELPDDLPKELPLFVIVIDELADLMIVAGKDVESSVTRLSQLARAAGMHLIIATQRPSTNVITGVIKANIVNRIAFNVGSGIDSRVILDSTGAETLLGNGDMLFSKPELGKPVRIQGCYVTEAEINDVTNHWRGQAKPSYHEEILMTAVSGTSAYPAAGFFGGADSDDPLVWDAADIVVTTQMGSTSTLQRRLKVGYARAGRIMDNLEQKGIVGPANGSKPREVLVDDVLDLESIRVLETR